MVTSSEDAAPILRAGDPASACCPGSWYPAFSVAPASYVVGRPLLIALSSGTVGEEGLGIDWDGALSRIDDPRLRFPPLNFVTSLDTSDEAKSPVAAMKPSGGCDSSKPFDSLRTMRVTDDADESPLIRDCCSSTGVAGVDDGWLWLGLVVDGPPCCSGGAMVVSCDDGKRVRFACDFNDLEKGQRQEDRSMSES